MIDFMVISTRSTKRGTIEIYPKFIIKKSTDLMIRGGDDIVNIGLHFFLKNVRPYAASCSEA